MKIQTEVFKNKNGDEVELQIKKGEYTNKWMYKTDGSTEWYHMEDENTIIITEDGTDVKYERGK